MKMVSAVSAAAVATATLVSFLSSPCEATKVPLVLFDEIDYPHAKCLDGTQAGFYFQNATKNEENKKWVIYLAGGGECDTESACVSQTYGSLGSSKYFASESDTSGWYLASDYCPYNLDLCGWNHVMNPYCSQDLHAGQVTEPSEKTWGLYFAGHLIVESMLDSLDKLYGLQEATDIVLSGVSAGGIGVWMNVDYIAERYPNARVSAATIAGHYYYATYYDGPNHTSPGSMGDFRESAMPVTYDLYQAYVDESCKAAMEAQSLSPSACMFSNYSLPYIESDSFVIQAQTDQVVLTGHDCWPESYMYDSPEQEFMKDWATNMSVALEGMLALEEPQGAPVRGVFAAACYTHTGFTHAGPFLEDMNFYEAFGNYYFQRTTPEKYKLSDTCGLMCNPSCV